MMGGKCTTDDWIGSDIGPPKKGNVQLTIDWFEILKIKIIFKLNKIVFKGYF